MHIIAGARVLCFCVLKTMRGYSRSGRDNLYPGIFAHLVKAHSAVRKRTLYLCVSET